MASKAKPNVEKALAQFMEIATTEVFEAVIIDSVSYIGDIFPLTALSLLLCSHMTSHIETFSRQSL